MTEYDVIYCRPYRAYKAKHIFEVPYSQNDYLALRIQKGLTFQHIRQNYKWIEATNEITKKRGFVAVDAIEPVEKYVPPCPPQLPAQILGTPPMPQSVTQPGVHLPGITTETQTIVPYQSQLLRKVSIPQKLSEFDLEDDTYVQFFGCDALEKGANAVAFNGHNLVNVFFLTPIICIHCKDYIWGRGRQGVSCSGK